MTLHWPPDSSASGSTRCSVFCSRKLRHGPKGWGIQLTTFGLRDNHSTAEPRCPRLTHPLSRHAAINSLILSHASEWVDSPPRILLISWQICAKGWSYRILQAGASSACVSRAQSAWAPNDNEIVLLQDVAAKTLNCVHVAWGHTSYSANTPCHCNISFTEQSIAAHWKLKM